MKKAFLSVCVMVLASLMLFPGCGNKNEDNATRLNAIFTVPEQMTKERMITIPTRQQYIYRNDDGNLHAVLEVMQENDDIINVTSKESIKLGKHDCLVYIYNGEDIDYQNLSEAEISGIVKPQDGDTILEWKNKKNYLRLFGNISKEELVEIAEGVTIK